MRIRTEARARMYARIEALKKNAEFEPLLARLDKQVAIEAAKNGKNGLVDRWELISTIIKASLRYDGVRYSAGEVSPTFHELALLVRAIVEKLKDDANRHDVLVALGAPAIDDWAEQADFNAHFPDAARIRIGEEEEASERAEARYKAMLHCLTTIAAAVPPPPAKRERKRPTQTNDLRAAVRVVFDYWERATGKNCAPYWQKSDPPERGGDGRHGWVPANAATRFVHDVIEFISPERLRSLRKVAEKMRDARLSSLK